jgi:hypothetical protein
MALTFYWVIVSSNGTADAYTNDDTSAAKIVNGQDAAGVPLVAGRYGSELAAGQNSPLDADPGAINLTEDSPYKIFWTLFDGLVYGGGGAVKVIGSAEFRTLTAVQTLSPSLLTSEFTPLTPTLSLNLNTPLITSNFNSLTPTLTLNLNTPLITSNFNSLTPTLSLNLNTPLITSNFNSLTPTLSLNLNTPLITSNFNLFNPSLTFFGYISAIYLDSTFTIYPPILQGDLQSPFLNSTFSISLPILDSNLSTSTINSSFALNTPIFNLNISSQFLISSFSVSIPQINLNLIATKLESGFGIHVPSLGSVQQISPSLLPSEFAFYPSLVYIEGGIQVPILSSSFTIYTATITGGAIQTLTLADINAIVNALKNELTGDIVTSVLSALNLTTIPVDVKKMNGSTVIGSGSTNDKWRGV